MLFFQKLSFWRAEEHIYRDCPWQFHPLPRLTLPLPRIQGARARLGSRPHSSASARATVCKLARRYLHSSAGSAAIAPAHHGCLARLLSRPPLAVRLVALSPLAAHSSHAPSSPRSRRSLACTLVAGRRGLIGVRCRAGGISASKQAREQMAWRREKAS